MQLNQKQFLSVSALNLKMRRKRFELTGKTISPLTHANDNLNFLIKISLNCKYISTLKLNVFRLKFYTCVLIK